MRYRNVLGLVMLMFAMILFSSEQTQSQPIQTSSTAKYVKTAVDTVTFTGVTVKRQGMITNQSADKNLVVYFSDKDGIKLTNSYVMIPPGKNLKFNCVTKKIFRNAVSDSVFSQVILGDVQLQSQKQWQGEQLQWQEQLQKEQDRKLPIEMRDPWSEEQWQLQWQKHNKNLKRN